MFLNYRAQFKSFQIVRQKQSLLHFVFFSRKFDDLKIFVYFGIFSNYFDFKCDNGMQMLILILTLSLNNGDFYIYVFVFTLNGKTDMNEFVRHTFVRNMNICWCNKYGISPAMITF